MGRTGYIQLIRKVPKYFCKLMLELAGISNTTDKKLEELTHRGEPNRINFPQTCLSLENTLCYTACSHGNF